MKIVLHVGFPKTGSSTFQYGLLKPLHDSGCLILRTWRQTDLKEHHDRRPSSRLFCRKPILPEYLNFSRDRLNVLSNESFTSPVRLRQNQFGLDIENPIQFPNLIKKQVEALYGSNIHWSVFVSIRNQKELIYSQYVEEYNLKKYRNIDIVFDDDGEVNMSGYEIYRFASYLKILNAIFGKENVNLLLFESIKFKFDEYCSQVAKVFELKSHFVKKALQNNHINQKLKTSKGYYTKDASTLVPFFLPKHRRQIEEYFLSDNLELQQMLGSDYNLSEFEYF